MFGSVVAVVVALMGDSPATTAAAVLFVLSAMLLAVLGRRSERGAAPGPMGWRVSIATAALAAALLLYLAEKAVVAVALLAVAVVFSLLVVLLGVLVVIASITNPPQWMLDEDGQLLGLWQRLRAAALHWSRRMQEHPNRGPERVYRQMARDLRTIVWSGGGEKPTAFSHFHVVVHPETLRALDRWMPIEDVAADLAHDYAEAQRNTRRKSSLVVVLISSDPVAPVGLGVIAGSFRESRPPAPQARAWAALAGPLEARGHDGAQRFAASSVSPARNGTRHMPAEAMQPHDDSTAYLLHENSDRTRILPDTANAHDPSHRRPDSPNGPRTAVPDPNRTRTWAPGADPSDATNADTTPLTQGYERMALTVRRCLSGGAEKSGAREFLLDGQRAWTVGRDKAADIQFGESQVSRLHLQLLRQGGSWVVDDRSSLGTTLNGRRVERGVPTRINPGDVLELGRPSRQGADRVLLLIS